MTTLTSEPIVSQEGFAGLRLDAEEYFALPNDGNRYELIDGVVHMSPSPTPEHQMVAAEIFRQLINYVRDHRLGLVLYETDVRLGKGPTGKDLVYRPEMVFITAERAKQVRTRIDVVPDLVVEIISPDSRGLDSVTKLGDYARAGVSEYWLIDPAEDRMTFYRLANGRFVEISIKGDSFESQAVQGFRMDLLSVRATFRGF